MINYHIYKALEVLFPQLSRDYAIQKNLTITEYNDMVAQRVGLLDENGEFIHRSFAKYFVGKFFAEFFIDDSAFDDDFMALIDSQFVQNVSDTNKTWRQSKVNPCSNPELKRFRGDKNPILLHFVNGELAKYFAGQDPPVVVE